MFEVIVPSPVQRQLDRLPKQIAARLLERILTLRVDPRPRDSVKLKGQSNEFRIRVGEYRVRYEIRERERLVVLLFCGHRKDAYGD